MKKKYAKPSQKSTFLVILTVLLIITTILFINWKIGSNNNEKKKEENSKNNPNQKTPKMKNWWLTEEEIEYAYQEMRQEISNSPKIQLVSPSMVRTIQEGGEISEDLKKASYIFFPIINEGSWNLLVFVGGESETFFNYNPQEYSVTPENIMKVAKNFYDKANLPTWLQVENVKEIPRQTNSANCGVYVIAYTRVLVKKYQERQEEGQIIINFDERDLIFSIAEERQKLKVAGFPKKV